MNRASVRAGVRRAWAFVDRLKLAQNVSAFEPLGINDVFRDYALDSSRRYEEVYLVGLSQSHYNFILEDYGYFQFSCASDNEIRYAYFPNPFVSTDSGHALAEMREYVEEGVISIEEYLQHIGEMRGGQHQTPIRYENSVSQYVEMTHPTSHFHFGHHADNRWPISRTLSPTAFTAIVAKQFYPHAWSDPRHRDTITGVNDLERVLSAEKAACALIAHDGFTDAERTQFYFD